MLTEKKLIVAFHLLPTWKRVCFESLITELSKEILVETVEVQKVDKEVGALLKSSPLTWLVSDHWATWLSALSKIRIQGHQKVVLSLLDSSPATFLPFLFLKTLKGNLPKGVDLVAHSPLTYEFHRVMEKIEDHRISFLHLPIPSNSIRTPTEKAALRLSQTDKRIVVGTLTPLTHEANLNYLVNVIHYMVNRSPFVRFEIIGNGAFQKHLLGMVSELGLTQSVEVHSEMTADLLDRLDIFLYVPAQNYEFIPLLLAASHHLPCVSTDVKGIEDLLRDGHEGFLIPVNETRPMGELLLRLVEDTILREALGFKLFEKLNLRYSAKSLVPQYLDLFSIVKSPSSVRQPSFARAT